MALVRSRLGKDWIWLLRSFLEMLLLMTVLSFLVAESEEELKGLLMWVKVESEKASLKLNIQKTKIMISGPITS